MIRGMVYHQDTDVHETLGGRSPHRSVGLALLEVTMEFRGEVMSTVANARDMGEAEGLRRIADAIDRLNGEPDVRERASATAEADQRKLKRAETRAKNRAKKKALKADPKRNNRCLEI